jgi:hypothetical protein
VPWLEQEPQLLGHGRTQRVAQRDPDVAGVVALLVDVGLEVLQERHVREERAVPDRQARLRLALRLGQVPVELVPHLLRVAEVGGRLDREWHSLDPHGVPVAAVDGAAGEAGP